MVSIDQFTHYRLWMAQTLSPQRMQVNVKPILSAIDQNSSRVTPTPPHHLRRFLYFEEKQNTPRNPNKHATQNSGNFWHVIYVNIVETWPQLWDLTPECLVTRDQAQETQSILRTALPSVRENSDSSSSSQSDWVLICPNQTNFIASPPSLDNSPRLALDVTHWEAGHMSSVIMLWPPSGWPCHGIIFHVT